eukprot:134986-Pleurochrysis_carterae.AAC.2
MIPCTYMRTRESENLVRNCTRSLLHARRRRSNSIANASAPSERARLAAIHTESNANSRVRTTHFTPFPSAACISSCA